MLRADVTVTMSLRDCKRLREALVEAERLMREDIENRPNGTLMMDIDKQTARMNIVQEFREEISS